MLSYADDAALCEETVEAMSKRLTAIADVSIEKADMHINVSKTYTQHVHKRQDINVTDVEVTEVAGKRVRVQMRLLHQAI